MELKNDEQPFNSVLDQSANTNSPFHENDTNFNRSIGTNTVNIKEEIADSVFVEEDGFLETKIKIENHDFSHNAADLFVKTLHYNEDNSIQKDLDITTNSAKELENFFSNELEQSIKKDCASIASAKYCGDYPESIDWKPVVENNIDFENLNENNILSEVSINNIVNGSNLSEILNDEKCVVKKCTQKKTFAELRCATEFQSIKSEKGIWHQSNNASRPKTFSCRFCRFKSNAKFHLALHIIEYHKEVAKAKNMVDTQYMTPGSNPDEILYKCNECLYVSNFKTLFKRHLLIHKSVDELEQTFRCASCPFVAKTKDNIINHMLVHVPAERQSIHKCPHCEFRAKHEQYIRRHVNRMHNSEKAKLKRLLKRRMLAHKMADEVIMFECDLCPFSTKRKDNLTQHRKVHVEVSEEDRIPCNLCSFKAKNQNSLRTHMRTHLDISQLTIHKCDQCPYQSRRSSLLKKHSLKHKKKEELPTFKCDLCEYQTFWGSYLRLHRKRMHTDPSEVDWKRCDKCEFKTKMWRNLKRHSIMHKKPEELEIFRCTQCSFSTKWKLNLKAHMVKHTSL